MEGRIKALEGFDKNGNPLIIEANIDLSLLEEQRVAVSEILWNKNAPSSTQLDALQGIVNFLDDISDKMYFREKRNVNSYINN